MFFSAKALYQHFKDDEYALEDFEGETDLRPTLKNIKAYVKACKRAIVNREGDVYFNGCYSQVAKWYRPWDVVPKLRNFQVPEGDYGIGVEVEMGFRSGSDARHIANLVKNWRYIAVDIEGGDYPIEATFPPALYSKLSSKTQVFRYLKLLRDNIDRVYQHRENSFVGTHINVSKGGVTYYNFSKVNQMYYLLIGMRNQPQHRELCNKYFGRNPYGGVYDRGGYLEYKLFNSTTDGKALKRYINIAVALTDLIDSDQEITEESVFAACELGYNK